MTMKRLQRALCVPLAAMLFLTGCMRPVRINNRAIIEGIGVDIAGGEYVLTLQIFDSKGGGSQTAVDVGKQNSLIVTVNGDSIAQALAGAELKQGKQIFYGQNKIIVLGEEAANAGLGEVLDFFGNNLQSRPNIDFIMAQGTAEEILTAKPAQSIMPALAIKSMLENSGANGKILRGQVMQAMTARETGMLGCYMPLARKTGEGENETIELLGTEIFAQGKAAGAVTPEETRGILWLRGEVDETQVQVKTPQGQKLTLQIIKAKTRLNVRLIDGEPHFTADINVKSSVTEKSRAGEDIYGKSGAVQSELCGVIRGECAAALQKCLVEYRADVFGLAPLLRQREGAWYGQNKGDYAQRLAGFTFDINVTAEITR